MAELIVRHVIRTLLRLLLSYRNPGYFYRRREVFPILSLEKVQDHFCCSLPFVFWTISLAPALYTSSAPSPRPL